MNHTDTVSNEGLHLQSLSRIVRIIAEFRRMSPGLPATYIDAFLAVALNPGHGPTEYARMVGTSQPIMSRTLLEIGEQARLRDEPLHLVVSRRHPESRRQIQYYLTAKGYALALRVGLIVQGHWNGPESASPS